MTLYPLPAALLTLALAAAPAAAQQAEPRPPVSQPRAETQLPVSQPAAAAARPAADQLSGDSLSIEIPADLQRSLDELAATLDRLGRRIANDPELRTSAVRTAQSFVGLAQLIVVQQADLIQDALRTAAERLADVAPPPAPQRR
jgi:hypothetical protein